MHVNLLNGKKVASIRVVGQAPRVFGTKSSHCSVDASRKKKRENREDDLLKKYRENESSNSGYEIKAYVTRQVKRDKREGRNDG